jgi:hypothetical protein
MSSFSLTRQLEKLHSVLEQAMKISGDSFYIAHTPVMRQEGNYRDPLSDTAF